MSHAIATPGRRPDTAGPTAAQQGIAVLVYFGLYMGSQFVAPENETAHWLTLVALPLALIWLATPRRTGQSRGRAALASVGIARPNLRSGLLWAVALGLLLGGLQVLLSSRRTAALELILSGRAAWLLPLTFALLVGTAAFTEEFFFRGVLQTRISRWLNSRVAGLLISSVLFGLYHLPYAYLHPRWPSHGDFAAAFNSAMGQGIIGGLILGAVFSASRQNLLAPVIVHALINSVPGMVLVDAMLKRGAGMGS